MINTTRTTARQTSTAINAVLSVCSRVVILVVVVVVDADVEELAAVVAEVVSTGTALEVGENIVVCVIVVSEIGSKIKSSEK